MGPRGSRRRLARVEVEDALREAIIDGRMKPGLMVTELDLAEALGFSRVPVREALRTLVAEGFVEVIHGRGVRVAGMDLRAVRDEFELRLAIEPAAVAIACQRTGSLELSELKRITEELRECINREHLNHAARLNAEFHMAAIRLAGNSRFDRLVSGIWSSLRLTLLLSRKSLTVAVVNQELENQHLALIDALSIRDAEHAHDIAASHIRDSYSNQRKLLSAAEDEIGKLTTDGDVPDDIHRLFESGSRFDHGFRLDLDQEDDLEEIARK